MKKLKVIEKRSCPKCGSIENQMNHGFNHSGTQRCKRKSRGRLYTQNPMSRAYTEEVREQAIKTYYSGVSGRVVDVLFKMMMRISITKYWKWTSYIGL